MKPKIYDSGPPVSEDELERLEARLRHKLPEPYRSFLLKHNGGRPEPNTFVPRGKSEPTETLNSFLAIGGDTAGGSLDEFLDLYRGRLPEGFLPVAYDAFGNLIGIMLSGHHRGQLYFWEHEEEGRSWLLAEDWDSFFSSFSK
ncbi:MAG TPA: SMI1/KNR4 family protein [Pyrinomonadaceae bacterium]|nr:SMI1/KNR4 family protein [Pyrinomonadaceae bacterium]